MVVALLRFITFVRACASNVGLSQRIDYPLILCVYTAAAVCTSESSTLNFIVCLHATAACTSSSTQKLYMLAQCHSNVDKQPTHLDGCNSYCHLWRARQSIMKVC